MPISTRIPVSVLSAAREVIDAVDMRRPAPTPEFRIHPGTPETFISKVDWPAGDFMRVATGHPGFA